MIQIAEMKPEDREQALVLHDKYIDSGRQVVEHYKRLGDDRKFAGVKAVNEAGEMIGSLIFIEGILFSTPHKEIERDILEMYPGKTFYSGDVMVIDKAYRDRHLTRPMFEKGIAMLKEARVDYVAGELWIHPNGSIPGRMIPKYFKNAFHLYDVENFYREYEDWGILCPVCGAHCTCGASIYVLEV